MEEKNFDKILGTMFGVAVGDALGAPIEFMSAEAIRRQYGIVRDMIGGGWLNVQPGEFTDDTQMTLAVAKGIVEKPENPIESIGAQFVKWYSSHPKDIGGTCASSISNAIRRSVDATRPSATDWTIAAKETDRTLFGRSAGNGSLMRTAYIGTYYNYIRTVHQRAIGISRMTHYDIGAANDCAAYSKMIHCLVRENNPNAIKLYAQSVGYKTDELSDLGFKPNPSGYVRDSFATALHCIYTTHSFEEAVTKAVNFGGDADTIGAITGGLAGALYGYDSIPKRWASCISFEDRNDIYRLCIDAATNEGGI